MVAGGYEGIGKAFKRIVCQKWVCAVSKLRKSRLVGREVGIDESVVIGEASSGLVKQCWKIGR